MIRHGYFVTGTDTGVGKSFISAALLHRAAGLGYTTVACKPVAAGADVSAVGRRNEDALLLMEAMSRPLDYVTVNPVCLSAAIAPHIAAREEGVELTLARLASACGPFFAETADIGLVEGAGGWRVPLNDRETLADFAGSLSLPVILVVAMRLGCLNHALLTAEAIAADGLTLAGWVANSPAEPPMERYRENLATLHSLLGAPLLGEVGFQEGGDFRTAAASLRLPDSLE